MTQPKRLSGGVLQTIWNFSLTYWPTFLILKQHAQYFPASPEGGRGAFCCWLLLWALTLAWVFRFGLFGVGSFWKGKEWLKRG
jgi:hypothetical protein